MVLAAFGMRRGMGELDRTGQGMLETYRIHTQARPDPCTGLVFQLAVSQRGICLPTHTVSPQHTAHMGTSVHLLNCHFAGDPKPIIKAHA